MVCPFFKALPNPVQLFLVVTFPGCYKKLSNCGVYNYTAPFLRSKSLPLVARKVCVSAAIIKISETLHELKSGGLLMTFTGVIKRKRSIFLLTPHHIFLSYTNNNNGSVYVKKKNITNGTSVQQADFIYLCIYAR